MIITNVEIADGTGNPVFKGCVEIENNIIKSVIKTNKKLNGKNVYNGGGNLLAPGFIDIHGHSDISILAAPEAEGKITQGITTELCGNCGLSVFPLNEKNRLHIENLFRKYNVNIDWSNINEYRNRINKIRPAINIASLCGHNTLRASVNGYKQAKLNRFQLELLEQEFSNQLQNGAFGLSLGLLYVPGKFASHNEISTLAKICSARKTLIAAHLRSEGNNIIESLNEFFRIAEKAGNSKIHISHLKIAGRNNFHKLSDILNMIDEMSSRNKIQISADRYPYTASMTQLSAYMPTPYSDMNDSELLLHLNAGSNIAKFIKKLNIEFDQERWKSLYLISTNSRKLNDMVNKQNKKSCDIFGESFFDISRRLQSEPEELCAYILSEDAPGAMAAATSMSYDNMIKIITQPFVYCCTDESARPADFSLGSSHPRGFASFPEFFRMASPILGISETIRKMTYLPAISAGILKRGLIAQGYFADLVLIDKKKMLLNKSKASFKHPHTKSSSILRVWVNGNLAYQCDKQGITRFGQFLSPL